MIMNVKIKNKKSICREGTRREKSWRKENGNRKGKKKREKEVKGNVRLGE